jgi:hypothetical protein
MPSCISGREATIKERIMHGFPIWFSHDPQYLARNFEARFAVTAKLLTTIRQRLFHLVPVLANILSVANAPAVIDEIFGSRFLRTSGGTPDGEAQHTPWQQSSNTVHSYPQGAYLRAHA